MVEAVISQLSRFFSMQTIIVKDLGHLTNRMARKVLTHNICTVIKIKYCLF
jgi:hypothetical protein